MIVWEKNELEKEKKILGKTNTTKKCTPNDTNLNNGKKEAGRKQRIKKETTTKTPSPTKCKSTDKNDGSERNSNSEDMGKTASFKKIVSITVNRNEWWISFMTDDNEIRSGFLDWIHASLSR
eukprot:12096942-Ditylum_brightwellii.AAC.1